MARHQSKTALLTYEQPVANAMTVALIGIGADSTNATPTPPVYSDGTFEYIPIPESEPTVESQTYGSTPLRHQSRSMATYLDGIDPDGNSQFSITGEKLATWPLHHDPNFVTLTYGETQSRGAYTALLRSLTSGDLIAFYTGLQNDNDPFTHRYLIGYFTVDRVVDLSTIDTDSTDTVSAHVDGLEANAHVKRFQKTGQIDPNAVLIDGKTPGGRLREAIPISQRHTGGHHYLTSTLEDRLQPVPGGNPDRPAYLGGIKKAHRLRIAPEAFCTWIQEHTAVVEDNHL